MKNSKKIESKGTQIMESVNDILILKDPLHSDEPECQTYKDESSRYHLSKLPHKIVQCNKCEI